MKKSPYIIDTCALTWAFRDAYPFEIAPAFWKNLEAAIATGDVISSRMVFLEIEKKDDNLHEWCKTINGFFKEIDQALLDRTRDVVVECPQMLNPFSEKDGADPFLIAMAWLTGGTVVTQEDEAIGRKKPKIPDVCKILKIRCVTVVQMMKELQWRLG